MTGADPGDPVAGDPNFMASLARGLAVIRAFAEHPQSQTIPQLSRRTGIPRAAVRRCIYTLSRLGYVAGRDRHFALGPRILALGHAYLSSTPLATAAQPFLDQVSSAVGESCSLAILDAHEREIVYLARSTTARRIMSVHLAPGSRLPAYCTSMGRVMLAHLPPAELKAYLSHAKLVAFTERTVTSREKLAQILEGVRRAGHAVVDQELELGLRSIAVPVRDAAGRVVSAMNVGTQAARHPIREMEARMLPALRAAAAELGTLVRP
ncbi:MAG TPA: IclR family transcriptional regulator C-terminal domain-containing protein [Anaeromyxobacter sp.]|nr:IclR family transcriptional regulator C-terminal domain-containing protein [Anaeromyxobacter sp.]